MTPLSLLMPPFLCRCSPLLLPVPYPTCSRCYCCPLERVCVYLFSAATSILVELLAFLMFPRYLSPCTAHPPPSHIRHPSISSSLRFVPPTKYFIPTPPSTPSLSISLLYISIYLSIYLLSFTFSLLYLLITLCLFIFILSVSVSWPLTNFLTLYY